MRMKNERYPGLTLRVLTAKGPAMGPGKAELLERIMACGSISGAARGMGMSYRRAWQLVEAMNRDFAEPLVNTSTGGARGGGAEVSALGHRALALFRRMELRAAGAVSAGLAAYEDLLAKPVRRQKKKIT
jgi:molybdate transport system regulatory protein